MEFSTPVFFKQPGSGGPEQNYGITCSSAFGGSQNLWAEFAVPTMAQPVSAMMSFHYNAQDQVPECDVNPDEVGVFRHWNSLRKKTPIPFEYLQSWQFLQQTVPWPHLQWPHHQWPRQQPKERPTDDEVESYVISHDIQGHIYPEYRDPVMFWCIVRKMYPTANLHQPWTIASLALIGHLFQDGADMRRQPREQGLSLRRTAFPDSWTPEIPRQVDTFDGYLSYLVPFGYQLILPSGDALQHGDTCLFDDSRGPLWAMQHPKDCRLYIRIVFAGPEGFPTYDNQAISDQFLNDEVVEDSSWDNITLVGSQDSSNASFTSSGSSETLVGEEDTTGDTWIGEDPEEWCNLSFNDIYDEPPKSSDTVPSIAKNAKGKRKRNGKIIDSHSQEDYPDINIDGVTLSNSRRVPNSFLLYRTWYSKVARLSDPTVKNVTISRTAADLWRVIPELEKRAWIERAATLRSVHKQRYPDYNYAPRKSAEIKRRRQNTEQDVPPSKRVRISIDAPKGKRKLYKDPADLETFPPTKRQKFKSADPEQDWVLLQHQQLAKECQKAAITDIESRIFATKEAQSTSRKRRFSEQENCEASSQGIKRKRVFVGNNGSIRDGYESFSGSYFGH
ncbi:hypothetical protein TWF696_005307 [Orbilia brochopaga]|uniref:HMG box domain-containing protein n=1 Tax=Orbilia brochopaga TaxID=3140254 RepID=A0AAV9V171_9PEZI